MLQLQYFDNNMIVVQKNSALINLIFINKSASILKFSPHKQYFKIIFRNFEQEKDLIKFSKFLYQIYYLQTKCDLHTFFWNYFKVFFFNSRG